MVGECFGVWAMSGAACVLLAGFAWAMLRRW